MVSRHDLRVYAAGYVDEEDLRVEVRGAAVGGRRTEEGIAQRRGGTGEDTEEHSLYVVIYFVYEIYFAYNALNAIIFEVIGK